MKTILKDTAPVSIYTKNISYPLPLTLKTIITTIKIKIIKPTQNASQNYKSKKS